MNTTTRTATATARRRLAQRIAGAEHQIKGYEALLAVARQHGMEYEIERATSNLAESEAELKDAIEEAIAAGFGPDDMERVR